VRVYSRKRAAERPERGKVVAEVLERDGHRCQFWKHHTNARAGFAAPLGCSVMLDVHEIIPRSVWKVGYLEPSNCVTLCRVHHGFVGDNPNKAHTIGLHGYSWQRPTNTGDAA
jgi:hypothetical protein